MKKSSYLLGLVVFLLITVLSGCNGKNNEVQKKNGNNNLKIDYSIQNGETAFFWGKGCPHCENVEKFLEENKGLEEKVKLKKFEVYSDKSGQKLYAEKAKECLLPQLIVPVLYKDGKCISGDTPIIEELKKSL